MPVVPENLGENWDYEQPDHLVIPDTPVSDELAKVLHPSEYYRYIDDDGLPFQIVAIASDGSLIATGSRNYAIGKDYTHYYRIPVGMDVLFQIIPLLISSAFDKGKLTAQREIRSNMEAAMNKLLTLSE